MIDCGQHPKAIHMYHFPIGFLLGRMREIVCEVNWQRLMTGG
jgi:hypothetical protein